MSVQSLIIVCLMSTVAWAINSGSALPEPVLQEHTHKVGMEQRRYFLHNASTQPRPLVVALHGWRRSGQNIRGKRKLDEDLFAGLDRLAIAEGFSVVYPVALNGMWNLTVGLQSKSWGNVAPPNDLAFVNSLVKRLINEGAADRNRVYLTGFSNGAIMSYRLLCSFGDMFAAAALISGTMSVTTHANCNTNLLPPLFVVMGTRDPILPYDGWLNSLGGELSVPEVLRLWSDHFKCKSQTTKLLSTTKKSLSRVRSVFWTGCRINAPVKLFRIEGGGHRVATFKPGPQRWNKRFGIQNTDIDTASEVWKFVKQFSK